MHEDVLPPIPLPPTTPLSPPSPAQLPLVPLVQGAAQQRHWLDTIARMRARPDADLRELAEIEAHITQGVSLPLLTSPSINSYVNTPTVAENADAVRTRLREYMQFGAVTRLPADTPLLAEGLCIQPLHVIIKAGRKPRLVIDLSRNLNDHLQYDYFRYSCVDDAVEASFPGCFYGKLDLSNCFLSFPLHPSVRKYFCFRFEGVLYQFRSMPFGLSTAPRVCTQLLSVVQFALAEQGITDIRYLDDFFLIAKFEKDMARDLRIAQSVIRQFGLVVNTDKTEGPAQQLSFLGVQLDSVNQTVSCTPERVEELTTLLRSLLRQRVITRGHTASLIGKLSFAAQVLPGARPFMRRMLDTLHQCKSRRHSAPVRIDPGFRDDVRFWVQQLHLWNGRLQWRGSRASPFVFASDASLTGFGFYLESTPTLPSSTVDSAAWPQHLRVGATFSGSYSHEHAHLHHSHTQIAWCELLAVVACASTYAPLLAGQSMLFFVDNSTDVHIINRQATRSKALAGLLRQLYSIAFKHNISIRAEHRPGVENTLADFLSRPELHRDDHVARWAAAYAPASARLSSVSLVSSKRYVSSSISSPVTPSASTPASPTRRGNASSAPSAPLCASTPLLPLQSFNSAASASCMPRGGCGGLYPSNYITLHRCRRSCVCCAVHQRCSLPHLLQLHVALGRGLAVVAAAQLLASQAAAGADGAVEALAVAASSARPRQHALRQHEDVLHRLVLAGAIVALSSQAVGGEGDGAHGHPVRHVVEAEVVVQRPVCRDVGGRQRCAGDRHGCEPTAVSCRLAAR